jgi:hypothetical protein
VADDDARAGEELARGWLRGKSELIDDLAALVDCMAQPLDETARAFLLTVGNSARAVARREDLPTPAGAPAPRPPDLAKAHPTPDAPPAPPIDLNEMLRRERERAARLEELARRNQEAFLEMQHAFAPRNQMRNDADWRR